MDKDLKFIYDVQKEVSILGGVSALLGWDEETYMPASGAINRAEQKVVIRGEKTLYCIGPK